jgi:hypothetical protein
MRSAVDNNLRAREKASPADRITQARGYWKLKKMEIIQIENLQMMTLMFIIINMLMPFGRGGLQR